MFNFDQHHHLSLVARPIRLSDVFLSAHFGPTKPHCVIYPDGVRALVLNRSKYLQFLCRKPLDELEYGLGAERGWLLACLSRESEHFAVIWEDMHEDVWELFMTGQIALLPDADSLSKIRALLQHNFRCLLRERRPFFEDLPFTEYTYKLLPPVRPKPLPLYINNDAFPSPLPLTEAIVKIQSRLHACFLLNSSASYALVIQRYPRFRRRRNLHASIAC